MPVLAQESVMTILGFHFSGDILKWKRNQTGMQLQEQACLPEPTEEAGTKFLCFPSDDFARIPSKPTRKPASAARER
jgi:hypothetical protein